MIIGFGYGFGLCLTARRAGIELLACIFAGCGFCYFSAIPCMCCILCIAAYTRMLMLLVIVLCPFTVAVFFELFYFLCLCLAANGTSVRLCSFFCMRGCFGYFPGIPYMCCILCIAAYTRMLMLLVIVLCPFTVAVFFELFYFLCLCLAANGTSVCLCSFFCMRGCFGYFSAIPCMRCCLDISAYLAGVLMIFCRILLP